MSFAPPQVEAVQQWGTGLGGPESSNWTLTLSAPPPVGGAVVLVVGVGNGWGGGASAFYGLPTTVTGLGATWQRVGYILGSYRGLGIYIGSGADGSGTSMAMTGGYATRYAATAVVLDSGVRDTGVALVTTSGTDFTGLASFSGITAEHCVLSGFLLDATGISRAFTDHNTGDDPAPWDVLAPDQPWSGSTGGDTNSTLGAIAYYAGDGLDTTPAHGFTSDVSKPWLGIGLAVKGTLDAGPPSVAVSLGGSGALAVTVTGGEGFNLSPIELGGTGALAVTVARSATLGPITLSGSGALAVTVMVANEDQDAPEVTTRELSVEILDEVIPQAPTALTVVVVEGIAETDAEFRIDGTLIDTIALDSDGYLGPTSITVPEELGAAGEHTLTVTQGGTTGGSATFTILRDPALHPSNMGPDAQAVDVPGAVRANGTRRWVFQDLLAGGLGSWIMPYNPTDAAPPYSEREFTTKVTTAGRAHVSEGMRVPVDWQFSGIAPDEEFAEKLLAYGNLNRRFYIIDHRGHAFKVIVTNVELVPRLQKIFGDSDKYKTADYIDGHDYTVTATVLDQDWVVPA